MNILNNGFWEEMANLAVSNCIVIDRPAGSAHPAYANLIYPFDYGYVEGTLAADGDLHRCLDWLARGARSYGNLMHLRYN